jgi:putative ABC transport system permease protein
LLRVDLGFHPDNVLTMRLGLLEARYPTWDKTQELHRAVLEKLRSLPGSDSAALVMTLPLSGRSVQQRVVPLPATRQDEQEVTAEYNAVTPGYFRAMGIPLLRGHVFEESDSTGTQRVAVISRSAADQFWPGDDPIGKQIRTGRWSVDPGARTVVGVVETEKHWGLTEAPGPKVYFPYAQLSPDAAGRLLRILTFAVVRTSGDPMQIAAAARQAVWDVDPAQPVVEVKSMRQLVDDSIATPRLESLLLGGMAAIALLLACLGIYGVLAHAVGRRTQEIGVRLALGASRRDILRTILSGGMTPVIVGIVLGLLASAGLTRLMANQLFGVGPLDALTYAGVTLLLLAVALLACYPSARRATKIDPITALRYE